jgi:glycosyltransferase involved in cell wall biosynthesis
MVSYSVITPARDEAANLTRLAAALEEQTRMPAEWIIVDDASRDGTRELAERLSEEHAWISFVSLQPSEREARGRPVVRAFIAGLAQLRETPDVVVKLDADVSFGPMYFAGLLMAFESEARLGIASGSAYEFDDGDWRQRFTTGTAVWGAARAYRWPCLQDVLPLEGRMGWDGIDEHKAQSRGWTTGTFLALPFYHHRREGERDGSRMAAWAAQGSVAHYVHYRPSYVLLRALFRATREPAALAMLFGYAKAWLNCEARCPDEGVKQRVRAQQRLRVVQLRLREARGRRVRHPVAPHSDLDLAGSARKSPCSHSSPTNGVE